MSKKGKTSWDKTMLSLATLSTTALGSAGVGAAAAKKKTRAGRQAKAKKFFNSDSEVGVAAFDGMTYSEMCRLDRLSDSFDLLDSAKGADEGGEGSDEDDFDELEELEGRKKKRKVNKVVKKKGSKAVLEKRFKLNPLSGALMDDMSRGGGGFGAGGVGASVFFVLGVAPQSKKPRKFVCPVSNEEGIYRDPSSGIRYNSLASLETIRENQPGWIKNLTGGGVEFFEAIGSCRKTVSERVGKCG